MEDTKDFDMNSSISTNHENGVVMQDKDVVSSQKLDRTKKPKELASKDGVRLKVTVPLPFSLATDKRMCQERRRSVDLSSPKEKRTPMVRVRRGSLDLTAEQMPKLSKSLSCVNKAESRLDSIKARSKTENGNVPTTNSKVTTRSLTTRNKQSQIPVKQGEDTTGKNQLGKRSPTFKALPLPRFYRRIDPTSKLDVASKTSSRGDKQKKKDISNGARETITRLIKSTKRALNPSKENVKTVVAAA